MKYIPAEVLAIYTTGVGGIASYKLPLETSQRVAVGLAVACLIATIVYFYRKSPSPSVRNAHLIVSPVAFLALAYPLSSPLIGGWYIGWATILAQALIALLAWTIVPESQ